MKKTIIAFILLLLPIAVFSQENLIDKEGVNRTYENGLFIEFDNFTAEAKISISDSSEITHYLKGKRIVVLPAFTGNLEESVYSHNWVLSIVYEGDGKYFDIESGDSDIPFLIDSERLSIRSILLSSTEEDSVSQILMMNLSKSEWDKIRTSQNTKFRIAGSVTEIPSVTLNQMTQITDKAEELIRDIGSNEETQGNYSSPFSLQWEGNLDRTPQVQPMPANPTNTEATITVRFEVNPDGTLGQISPLRKINPELERELMQTLRSWRFSGLPSGVPQETQWGTITFRFVTD